MKFNGLLSIGVALGALASASAHAQGAASAAADKDTRQAQDIIVTGSRVITNGNSSPTPLTVVTMQTLQAAHPASAFEALLDVPAFAGSKGSTQSSPSGNGANSGQINALNLRGLGPVRTLVLFDGHRVPPTEQDGLIDANIIPQMLLQRVDVATGGASAVYGSDAIGGVVNFITDTKFKGLKLDIQRGISQYGDDGTYKIQGAFGTNLFGGRGHFEVGVDIHHEDGLLTNQRSQFAGNWTVQGTGTQANPFNLVSGAVNPVYTWGGKIVGPTTGNPLLNYTFNQNGVASPFTAGTKVGSVAIGGDGIYDTAPSLKPETTQKQVFARFDLDVSSNVHYHIAGSYTKDHSFNQYGNVNSTGITISSTDAFLPTALQNQLLAAGIKTFTFSKKYAQGLVPPSNIDNYTTDYYINTGFDGTLGKYKWNVSYTHNNVRQEAWSNYTLDNGKFFAALDAVKDPATGNVVCNVTLTNPGLYPGCVPINLFGPSSETQQMADYVRRQGVFITKLPSHDADFTFSGSPFNTWAGPVDMALSGEWRRQGMSLASTNPTIDYDPLNCTGLRFNCTNATATSLGTTSYNGGVPPRTPVSSSVIEAAIEANVPLLEDFVLAKRLSVNLADRYARYHDIGNPNLAATPLINDFNADTWKIGIDWQVNDMLTLRATRSRDIRAPNLYEMYQSNGVTFTNGNTDLLTNSNVTGNGQLVQIVNGGNPQLKPEKANTLTLGAVIKPTRNFSIAIDYYNISINDFITRINGFDVAAQQACYAGNAYFCSLQVRPGPITDTSTANAVTRWYSIPVNIAALKTHGVDVEANWHAMVRDHPLALRLLADYQPHVYFIQPGQNVQDFASAIGTPAAYTAGAKFRGTFYAHYEPTDGLAVDWETRVRGLMHESPDATLYANANTDAPAFWTSNLTLTWTVPSGPLKGQAAFYFNVTNLFNAQAPVAASYVNQGSPGLAGGFVLGDDPTGRYFRAGMRMKW